MQPPGEGYNPKRIGNITASPISYPRCPKCGSTLLFNGNLVWCTFIGSSTEKACDFGIGIHRNITRSEATVLWWKSLDIGQRLTDDQIAMFRGSMPAEEVNPKVDYAEEDSTYNPTSTHLSPDAIHHWFELSYAQYLTIPRSALQSMPNEWQSEFVALLEELDEEIDWQPKEGRYWVQLKDKRGRYVADPLMDYERGRRRLERKKG